MIRIKEAHPNIYWITANSKQELARACMRFQEYYESPKFHGTVFTRKEFTTWYSKISDKYFNDWSGFNFPYHSLIPFYHGFFKGLTRNENKIIRFFQKKVGKEFYVIGSMKKDKSTFFHEMSHALFFLSIEYRQDAFKIISKAPIPKKFEKRLKKMGYREDLVIDEFIAYLIDGTKYTELKKFSDVADQLRKNLSKFVGSNL